MVKFVHSAAAAQSFAGSGPGSSGHAEAASHMPQLEGPTTKNTQQCTRGLWGEKGKIKSLKKKKGISEKVWERELGKKSFRLFLLARKFSLDILVFLSPKTMKIFACHCWPAWMSGTLNCKIAGNEQNPVASSL